MDKSLVRLIGLIITLLLTSCFLTIIPEVNADTLKSANYEFIESNLGNGGLIQANSPSYQSSISIGDLAVGHANSTTYQIEAGSKTTGQPALSFTVSAGTNFSSFSPTSTSVATSTFTVLDYTSYGYVVQIYGTPPTNGSYSITPMSTAGSSHPGTDQFGINLVANTSPSSFGANPNHGQFGFGEPTTNYDTPNEFRYVSGDTIASAPESSGLTTYTISYIINVADLTPGGQYTTSQSLICIGTY